MKQEKGRMNGLQSRKGTQMTCNNCGEPNHNVKDYVNVSF